MVRDVAGTAKRRALTNLLLTCLLVGGLVLAACSPEATRTRGGGPGADIGNHQTPVQIHGQLNPYYETPRFGQASSK
jgi:hypothetical protein